MKTALYAALFTLVAGAAHAAPITCNTNVDQNPRKGNTSITINSVDNNRANVTEQTSGGMAHFITAPRTFQVSVERIGPENARYTNRDERFELTITFQPIGGKIRGTLKTEVMGREISSPVVCVMAFN